MVAGNHSQITLVVPWILLLVWSLAWSALITSHLPWWIWIGFHALSALHTNCVWSCSAPAYLADYCISTSLVPGRSALRSAAHGDIVVLSHQTGVCGGWPQQLECFACWFEVFLFRFRYFCKALKNTSIWFSVLMTGHTLLSLYYIL